MQNLPGFEISELIHSGPLSTVYRAVRTSDGARVVVKCLSSEHPGAGDLARYRYAWELTRELRVDGVCPTIALVEHRRRPVLVMEDVGAQSLQSLAPSLRGDVRRILRVAIQIASALEGLHRAGVIHKDVNPANVVVVPGTLRTLLIDFDIASRLLREHVESAAPATLQGTLAYMSPEQTGRVNRSVDHRSDLYSFGVTLYEVLSGRLPFPKSDPMAMVHGHIAVAPEPLHRVAPIVPEPLSQVVAHLMAKTPEQRYQSAAGVRADLEHCLAELERGSAIPPFPLGESDVPLRLQISQRLYGRETETASLLAAFERAAGGGSEWILVSGFSGIGKTSLVREVHRPIVEHRGRFVSGKYDALQNVPYDGLIQALQTLVRDVLTESEEGVAAWRDHILAALGSQAQVIVDVLPELRLVLGPQPPVIPLPPAEAMGRFHHLFHRFVRSFCGEQRPLVLFLDDLQWADASSLQLLRELVADPQGGFLLVVGAYRDNEVSSSHPLMRVVGEMERAGERLASLGLRPLGRDALGRLVADSLRRTPHEVAPLAEVVHDKTQGNPFFVDRFLRSLADDGTLRLDAGSGRWVWDIERVYGKAVTENVAKLLADQVKGLPEASQAVLQLAACAGNRFSLRLLADLTGRPAEAVVEDLWAAVREDLVEPLGHSWRYVGLSGDPDSSAGGDGAGDDAEYRFVHDRVQEAAWTSVDEAGRRSSHLRIGRLLQKKLGASAPRELLFDVVNHLGLARELLETAEERLSAARLHLDAGRAASAAGANREAMAYLESGSALLGADAWGSQRELAFALRRSYAEAALAIGQADAAALALDAVGTHSATREERVDVARLRVRQYGMLNDYSGAVDAGLAGLTEFVFPRWTSPVSARRPRCPIPRCSRR
jgi:serine/threonine protein kinase